MLVQVRRVGNIPNKAEACLDIEDGLPVLWVLEEQVTAEEARDLEDHVNRAVASRTNGTPSAARPASQQTV